MLPARQPYLFHPTAGETYPSRPRVFSSRRMSARASRPHILPFYVFTCPMQRVLILPLDAGEVLPARQSYYSVFTCPTQRVLISRWTPARCSRPDNLNFFCLYLSNTASLDLPLDAGEVLPARQSYFFCLYLSNTASLILLLDAGEVLPAIQTLFRLLAPKYRTPSNATYPAVLAILAFSPPPVRFDHPAHEY